MIKATSRLTLPLSIALAALGLAYLGLRGPARQDRLQPTGIDLSAPSATGASSLAGAPDGVAPTPVPLQPAGAQPSATLRMPPEPPSHIDEVVVDGEVAMIVQDLDDVTSAQVSMSAGAMDDDVHLDPHSGTATLKGRDELAPATGTGSAASDISTAHAADGIEVSGSTATARSPASSSLDVARAPRETAPSGSDTDVAWAPPE